MLKNIIRSRGKPRSGQRSKCSVFKFGDLHRDTAFSFSWPMLSQSSYSQRYGEGTAWLGSYKVHTNQRSRSRSGYERLWSMMIKAGQHMSNVRREDKLRLSTQIEKCNLSPPPPFSSVTQVFAAILASTVDGSIRSIARRHFV